MDEHRDDGDRDSPPTGGDADDPPAEENSQGSGEGDPSSTGETDSTLSQRLAAMHDQARYTRWIRWHMLAAVAVFFVGGLFGFGLVSALRVETLAEFAQQNESALPDTLTFWAIFSNNVVAMAFLSMGTVTFGVLSALGLFVNGIIVGAVLPLALQEVSLLVVAALIVPHGIIEIPALLMAGAIGFRVPHRVLRYLLGWDDAPITRVELYELGVLFVVLLVMIAVAAFIEVNLTPRIADSLMQ